jgi:hypothetical protein
MAIDKDEMLKQLQEMAQSAKVPECQGTAPDIFIYNDVQIQHLLF